VSVVALVMLVFVLAFRLIESRIVKTHEVGSW
jgi:hypothetical protein